MPTAIPSEYLSLVCRNMSVFVMLNARKEDPEILSDNQVMRTKIHLKSATSRDFQRLEEVQALRKITSVGNASLE